MTNKEAFIKVEKLLRQNIRITTEIHNPGVHAAIDWQKPFRVINDTLEEIFPKIENENLAIIVMDVYDTAGNRVFYSVKLEATNSEVNIYVSDLYTAEEVMDDSVYMDNREIVENIIAQDTMMVMIKAARNKPAPSPKHDAVCSGCGRSDLQLNIIVNVAKGNTEYLCAVCMLNASNDANDGKLPDLEELNSLIKKTKKLLKKLKKELPTMDYDPLPAALEKFAITPLSIYKTNQAMLAELKSQKMTVLMSMDNPTKLKHELKKALKNEDFEMAAILRDKIDKMGY